MLFDNENIFKCFFFVCNVGENLVVKFKSERVSF